MTAENLDCKFSSILWISRNIDPPSEEEATPTGPNAALASEDDVTVGAGAGAAAGGCCSRCCCCCDCCCWCCCWCCCLSPFFSRWFRVLFFLCSFGSTIVSAPPSTSTSVRGLRARIGLTASRAGPVPGPSEAVGAGEDDRGSLACADETARSKWRLSIRIWSTPPVWITYAMSATCPDEGIDSIIAPVGPAATPFVLTWFARSSSSISYASGERIPRLIVGCKIGKSSTCSKLGAVSVDVASWLTLSAISDERCEFAAQRILSRLS